MEKMEKTTRANMLKRLPESFRPLFWSYDFSAINLEKHKKLIVTQTINYGTLEQWRWIARRYGKMHVGNILEELPATALRPRARRLAGLLFNVRQFNNAPRGAQR